MREHKTEQPTEREHYPPNIYLLVTAILGGIFFAFVASIFLAIPSRAFMASEGMGPPAYICLFVISLYLPIIGTGVLVGMEHARASKQLRKRLGRWLLLAILVSWTSLVLWEVSLNKQHRQQRDVEWEQRDQQEKLEWQERRAKRSQQKQLEGNTANE